MHIVIGFTDNSESSSQRCGEKTSEWLNDFSPVKTRKKNIYVKRSI